MPGVRETTTLVSPLPAEVDEHARAEPAELLPLPVAEGVEPLQSHGQDAHGQLPVGVAVLLGHHPPDGHQGVRGEEGAGQGGLHQGDAGHGAVGGDAGAGDAAAVCCCFSELLGFSVSFVFSSLFRLCVTSHSLSFLCH